MENLTIKNHLEELKTNTSRMLVYHSDNLELKSYFKDTFFRLEMIEQLMNVSGVDWLSVDEAFRSILKLDNELTNIELNVQIKPVITEVKTGKIKAKLYNFK
jgi:hypothetical protein